MDLAKASLSSKRVTGHKQRRKTGPAYRAMAETRRNHVRSQDPITLKTSLDQVSLNGKAYKSSYDATAKTITLTTPVGRQVVTTLDASGRVVQVQPPGVLPVAVHYDTRGRPDSVTRGTRAYTYAYDSFGRVQSIADPLHTSTLGYDAANRLKSVV